MYEYMKGTLIEATLTQAIVEVGGLGFSLWIPFNNYAKLPPFGTDIIFYVSFVVREDSQKLYGFLTRLERDLFESLIEITGIGPKTGLALIGHMEIDDLQRALSQGNTQAICKIPGIGRKTAERLIVEMRDKIKKGSTKPSFSTIENHRESSVIADATSALIHLGYTNIQAQKAIKTALSQTEKEPELAQLITLALRNV